MYNDNVHDDEDEDDQELFCTPANHKGLKIYF